MKPSSPIAVLKLMHQAMIIAQVLFAGIMFYLVYGKTISPPLVAEQKLLQVTALFVAGGSILSVIWAFKKRLALIKEQPLSNLKEKLSSYKLGCMLRWGLLEIASFYCIICFFLTGNYAFFALAALLIIYFALQAPSKNKVSQHLDTSSSELDQL